MAKAHEELKQLLGEQPGKAFALDVTRLVYGWAERIPDDAIRYRIFEELTVRYETGEKTRLGLDRQEHYRFDAVLFIQPGYRALNQNQCFTVGIELKNSKADLMGDHKMDKYLGWTDLFFIGVPAAITEDAIMKADEVSEEVYGNKSMVGVFDIENGIIYKIPAQKQNVSLENRLKVQEQVIYNIVFDEMKSINVELEEISLEEISIENPPIDKINIGEENNQEDNQEPATIEQALSTPMATASSEVPSAIPSENPSDVSDTTSDSSSQEKPTKSSKSSLDEDFVKARNEKRAENRAKREELAKDLAKRNSLLTTKIREQLAGLSDRDQLVFWCVRDATTHGGINGTDIPSAIGQSSAAVNRSIKKLKEGDLVILDGAPKYGKFKVIGDALKSSRCVTCRHNDECQGGALHCGSYQSVEQ